MSMTSFDLGEIKIFDFLPENVSLKKEEKKTRKSNCIIFPSIIQQLMIHFAKDV